jgi:hypothetical protein
MMKKKNKIEEAEELVSQTVTGKRGRGLSKKKTASVTTVDDEEERKMKLLLLLLLHPLHLHLPLH